MQSSTDWEETHYNNTAASLNKVSSQSSQQTSSSHTPKTMEQLWNDINLAVNSNHHNNSHFIFQDLLPTRPSSNEPSTNRVLSLNSVPGFDFLDNIDSNSRMQTSPISTLPTFNSPFEALASSSSFVSFGKKRVQECDGDRRHKRMIKNRESAARSRARKQAYTNELEHEVALLMEENKKLREQQEQLRVAAAAQITRKRTLHRTLTAPF